MDSITQEEALRILDTQPMTMELAECIIDTQDRTYEITTTTQVKTAAKHKEQSIIKVSRALAILPISGDTYANMVRESAKNNGATDEDAAKFEVSKSFYEHTDCYPVCKNPKSGALYLYGIYEKNTAPLYFNALTSEFMTKEEVSEFLTPAEAKKLMNPEKDKVVENKSHDIKHNVMARTVKLENVRDIRIIN